ncbi:MAG: helix-turn-helix domain-containing protein [Syntrophomonas sp.]
MRPLNEKLKADILEASRQEFLSRGFAGAQMRKIARAANTTTGSIYKYYADKEALFDALVQSPAEYLEKRYRDSQQNFLSLATEKQVSDLNQIVEEEQSVMLQYIYDHFDAFKLITCHSTGTKYAHYIDTLAEIETVTSRVFIDNLATDDRPVRQIDDALIHIVSNAMLFGLFETVAHDMPREKALAYARCLRDFYAAGWSKILGI